jgi:hypothetical protein
VSQNCASVRASAAPAEAQFSILLSAPVAVPSLGDMTKRLGRSLALGLSGAVVLLLAGHGSAAETAVQEAAVRWGPFVLPPAGMGGDADHANVVIPDGPKPCTGCYLVGIEPDLVFADGRSANLDNGVMLHHAVFFASDKVDATCGGAPGFGNLGERFFASGNERTGGALPAGFGYPVSDAPWNGVFHVMNHSPIPQTVFVELRTRWVRDGVQPVRPVWRTSPAASSPPAATSTTAGSAPP